MAVRLIAVCAALAVLLCACGGNAPVSTPEMVRGLGVLRVAVSDENDWPYFYRDESGEPRGIEPEIARKLADALGAQPAFTVYARGDVLEAVRTGAADIAFAGFERGGVRGSLKETGVLYTRRPFVLTRRGEPYPSEAAMAGRVILHDDGLYHYSFAQPAQFESGRLRILDGNADAMLCDEFMAYAAVRSSEEQLQAEPLQNAEIRVYVAVMARRNEALFAYIDSEITKLSAQGGLLETVIDQFIER